MSGAVVFTGPSLHPQVAQSLTDAVVLPPIRRGDLESINALDPDVIGIIDGEFFQSLAVSPKEILPFLEKGVRVYGAASMGALRAVELERFGMTGIGRVFRLFRSGVLDSDDEVALTYCPLTYQAQSEPLVNARYALRAARSHNILTRAEVQIIINMLKERYFPERSRALMIAMARDVLGPERAMTLRDFLVAKSVNAKQADAKLLIRVLEENRSKQKSEVEGVAKLGQMTSTPLLGTNIQARNA